MKPIRVYGSVSANKGYLKRYTMSMEDLVQDLKSLTEADLQEIATYIAFLKFRAQRMMTPLDKGSAAEERQPAVHQIWPGIEKPIDVGGSDAYIAHTHIPVWTLASYRRLGWT